MKVSFNVIRLVLEKIEDESLNKFLKGLKLESPHDEREMRYHLKLAMDAGLVHPSRVMPTLTVFGLTFLEAFRTKGFMANVQTFAAENSVPFSLGTINFLIQAYLKHSL